MNDFSSSRKKEKKKILVPTIKSYHYCLVRFSKIPINWAYQSSFKIKGELTTHSTLVLIRD